MRPGRSIDCDALRGQPQVLLMRAARTRGADIDGAIGFLSVLTRSKIAMLEQSITRQLPSNLAAYNNPSIYSRSSVQSFPRFNIYHMAINYYGFIAKAIIITENEILIKSQHLFDRINKF